MPGRRARGMIVAQPHDHKSRHVSRRLELLQIVEENFRPLDIRIIEIEPAVMHVGNRRERRIAHAGQSATPSGPAIFLLFA